MGGLYLDCVAAEEQDHIFNGTYNGNKLLEDALFLLWTWLKNFEKDFVVHYNHWSSNLRDAFVLSRG